MSKKSQRITLDIAESKRYDEQAEQNETKKEEKVRNKRPSLRVRQAKIQIKRINEEYLKSLQGYFETKRSLEKTNRSTEKMRFDFLKQYGNKRFRVQQNQLEEKKKKEEEERKLQLQKKTKSLKLGNEIGIMYCKNETEVLQAKTREKNKKQSENFQKQLKIRKTIQDRRARDRYLTIKVDQNRLLDRKRNRTALATTRAKHNYLSKVSQEMDCLENYYEMVEVVNNLSKSFNKNEKFSSIPENVSKSFFITTKNSLKD